MLVVRVKALRVSMFWLIRAAVALATVALAGAGPPPTPKIDYVERLFGMTFEDPYHWMEAGGREFDAWLSAQGAYARGTLDAIPGRTELLEQLHRLNSGETRVGGTVLAGGQWVYSKTRPQDAIAKIFVRPAIGPVGEIPHRIGWAPGENLAVPAVVPSRQDPRFRQQPAPTKPEASALRGETAGDCPHYDRLDEVRRWSSSEIVFGRVGFRNDRPPASQSGCVALCASSAIKRRSRHS